MDGFFCSSTHGFIANRIYDRLDTQPMEDSWLERTTDSYLRGSETSTCLRRLYYSRQGTEPDTKPDPRSLMKMALGDVIHNWVRGVLIPRYTDYKVACWGTTKEKEITLSGDVFGLRVVAHPDGILGVAEGLLTEDLIRMTPKDLMKTRNFTPVALLEIKSTGNWGFRQVLKNNFDSSHYSYGYALQANRYIHLWNSMYPALFVNEMCIVVVDTDMGVHSDPNIPIKDFWFRYNENILKDDIEYRRLRVEGVPPRLYETETEHWECKFCSYRKRCWNGLSA